MRLFMSFLVWQPLVAFVRGLRPQRCPFRRQGAALLRKVKPQLPELRSVFRDALTVRHVRVARSLLTIEGAITDEDESPGTSVDTAKMVIGARRENARSAGRVYATLSLMLSALMLIFGLSLSIIDRGILAVTNAVDVGFNLVGLWGQSNMAGRGIVLDARLDILDPRIFTYGNQAITSNAYSGVISQATEPLLQHDGATGVGPGLPFGRWLTTVLPSNRRILLVPCAHGGQALATTPTASAPWNVTNTGAGALYPAAIASMQAALTQAGANSRITALLWLQGETDGDAGVTASTYQTALDALIAKARVDLALPNLPFSIGQMVPDFLTYQLTPGTSNRQVINAVHIDTPRRVLYTAFAYGPAGSAYNNADNNHYNAYGQRGPVAKPQVSMGHSFFLAYQRALTNVMGTAPIAPSTAPTIIQTSATALAVSWAQVSGRVTGWVVRYTSNGGTSYTTTSRSATNIDVTDAITGLAGGATVSVQVATVNEQGTSAWGPATTITEAVAPNVVTSLTGLTASGSSQPLTWVVPAVDSTHSAAATYLVEYQQGAGAWTVYSTVSTNNVTVTGLAPSTTYNYRVTAQNIAGSSAAVIVSGLATAAATGPISVVGVTAFLAYGLRKQRDTWSGNAILVRRDSDNTTSGIGFTTGGDLDTTALLAFVGSANGYIVTIYDQSGTGFDMTNPTTAQQPQIVSAGAVAMLNGKPTMLLSGAQILFDSTNPSVSSSLYSQGALTVAIVMQAAQPTAITVPFSDTVNAVSPTYRYWIGWTNANSTLPNVQVRNDANTNLVSQAGTVALYSANGVQYSYVDSGTQTGQWVNGGVSAAMTNYVAARTGTCTPTRRCIGGTFPGSTAPGYFVTGKMSEVLVFPTALSTANRQTVEANQKAYYGTP